ncbi:MAG: DUF1836 domain-containing protein [Clostridia bacterium]|nr:DUF1836 domain-containing protein [Clostridia bacterium]
MNTSVKQQIAESVCGFRLPRYSEIPNVGLYLEQTTKYINGYLAPLGCMEITTSMLSNYVKKGLVPNPVKKLYYAEHISHLFFITIAKNIISLEDVRLMLEMKEQSYSTPMAYDYMCEELENMILYIFGFKKNMDKCGKTSSDEKDILYSLCYSVAHMVHLHARFKSMKENENLL